MMGEHSRQQKRKFNLGQYLSRMRLLCLEANKQSTNSCAMRLSRKKKQMKKLQTNDRGIRAVQPFKPTTPIGIYQERRVPINRHTRRIILSVATVVLAGLAM